MSAAPGKLLFGVDPAMAKPGVSVANRLRAVRRTPVPELAALASALGWALHGAAMRRHGETPATLSKPFGREKTRTYAKRTAPPATRFINTGKRTP